MDVDAALAEVPVNIMPLLDDTDFKSREESVAYNAAGLELIWHFTTTAGATTATVVTPTTGGNYDWAHQDGGMYTIEIPASGGASANNDTEGFGWFTGKATGVLPWRGPVIGFRAAGLNNALIDGGDTLDVNVTEISGDSTAADNCELMFDGTGYAGGATKLGVDAVAISGDSTAADNAESFFDGTGYAGTNNVIPTVTTLTGHTAQTGDAYAIVNHADYGNAKLVRSTTPANTLDVSATGEAGLDFNNIKDATGAHTLTNITVPVVTSVAANGITATSIAADAINAAAVKADAVTKIQAGLATPTNITAGTITTVTNLTNAPTAGDFTATMKTSAQTAANAALVANNLDHLLKTAVADKNNLGDAGGNEVVTSTIMSLMLSKTDDADSFVYTTDSLEARADLGATAAELAKVPKSDSNVTWNATALASIQAEATDALNAYDPPTNAELEARTLVAASYFDPATDKVTLATTQGAITWAQQKIAASVTGEGALHITNADAAGFGTYAAGGQAGAYNKGTDAAGYGEYNEGPTYGQINYGTGAASYGQRNLGIVNDTQGDITGNITGNWSGAVGSVTGAVGAATGAVGSVTGAVGSVTGNVGGNVAGSVASVTATVNADVKKVNGVTITGDGSGTPFNV